MTTASCAQAVTTRMSSLGCVRLARSRIGAMSAPLSTTSQTNTSAGHSRAKAASTSAACVAASHFSCFIRGFRSNENAQGLVMLVNAFDRFGHGGLGLAACCRKTQRSSLTDRGFPGGGILPRCTAQISHSTAQQSQHLMCGPRSIHKKTADWSLSISAALTRMV